MTFGSVGDALPFRRSDRVTHEHTMPLRTGPGPSMQHATLNRVLDPRGQQLIETQMSADQRFQ